MGAFGGLTLTNKGKILQSKAQTGITLQYTRIAMGDGQLGSTPILALNGLIREKKSLNISKLKIQSGGKAIVGTTWSNNDLSEGFYFREIGVFANDPDEGEILYCYGNSGALAEYIPPGSGSDIIERNLDIVTVVGNASNVTATIDSSLTFASQQDLEVIEQQVIENSNNLMQLQNDFTKHSAEVGQLSDLQTSDKTTIVNAINEVFRAGNNVKSEVVTALLSIDPSLSITQYSTWSEIEAAILAVETGVDTSDATATAAQILNGATAYVMGQKITGSMPNRGSIGQVVPGTSNKNFSFGFYDGFNVAGDPDLIAANIIAGKNIFGVAGTADVTSMGGMQKAVGLLTTTDGFATVAGLTFRPKIVVAHATSWGSYDFFALYVERGILPKKYLDATVKERSSYLLNATAISDDGFRINVGVSSGYSYEIEWLALG